MTNTIPNVPRELLETLIEQHITAHGCTNHTARQAQLILCAPSPAGVDGLEVVGWYRMDGRKDITPYPSVCATWHKIGVKVGAAYSDSAHAIIDGLRGEVGAQRVKTCIALKERNDAREERDAALAECERLRMQLAACGVVALANTIESAGEARQMHQDYMSASCSDVADAVDREIALRAERDDLLQQLAVRDEEIERIRVQLMTIASAEPARHSIEWAKAMASTGNNEVYAKWREAFDQRDQQAQRIGELEGLLRHAQKQVPTGSGLHMRIDAALSAGKEGE